MTEDLGPCFYDAPSGEIAAPEPEKARAARPREHPLRPAPPAGFELAAPRRGAASGNDPGGAVTGGHLGSGLGVVELTVALLYVFDTPRDRFVWDVGHQVSPHKILTGRRARTHTLRAKGGPSGFTKRAESAYDPFGAAHAEETIEFRLPPELR